MLFSEAVHSGIGKYATFTGRARRSEYWWFCLAAALVFGGWVAIGEVLRTAGDGAVTAALVALWLAGYLGLIIPNVAVLVRRLHDTGRTGWWLLLLVLGPFGGLVLLVFACQDSQPDNEYGPSPKSADLISA